MANIRGAYTRAQYMRFPMVFGSILATFAVGFTYRREIFSKDIEMVRLENQRNEEKWQKTADEIQRVAREQYARERQHKKISE